MLFQRILMLCVIWSHSRFLHEHRWWRCLKVLHPVQFLQSTRDEIWWMLIPAEKELKVNTICILLQLKMWQLQCTPSEILIGLMCKPIERVLFVTHQNSEQVLYYELITCVIARSNPKRLFLFYACGNMGHYQSTMTPNRFYWLQIVMSWAPSAFSLKMPNKCAYCTAHTSLIKLRNDHHAWTDRNSLTGIDRQWVQKLVQLSISS